MRRILTLQDDGLPAVPRLAHFRIKFDAPEKRHAEMLRHMAQHFSVPFLGSIELDPEVRKSGDGGKPIVLEGENSPHAASIFGFARKVLARVGEIKAGETASVIQIQ